MDADIDRYFQLKRRNQLISIAVAVQCLPYLMALAALFTKGSQIAVTLVAATGFGAIGASLLLTPYLLWHLLRNPRLTLWGKLGWLGMTYYLPLATLFYIHDQVFQDSGFERPIVA